MRTKLAELASFAEIIASIGVILSLIFVGMQINEGNRETRAATLQAASDTQISLMAELSRYADTWEKVLSGDPLADGEESRRGIILYNMVMTENVNMFHQFNAGYLDEANWAKRQNNFRRLVKLPMYDEWKDAVGASGHPQEFLDILASYRVITE